MQASESVFGYLLKFWEHSTPRMSQWCKTGCFWGKERTKVPSLFLENSKFWLADFYSYSLEAASFFELTLENVLGVFSAFHIRKCYLHLRLFCFFPFLKKAERAFLCGYKLQTKNFISYFKTKPQFFISEPCFSWWRHRV